MRVYTSDERFHQELARLQQRTRYMRAPSTDPRRILARAVESDVAQRLRERGYYVSRTGHNEHFDLNVEGVRVEVKAATWSEDSHRYAAALRSNSADVLVLGCLNSIWRYFVIPFAEVCELTHIKISSHDPADYAGRFRDYLEAWPLIDELVARGVNHWQMPMWRYKA